jgi:GNAT superfamily N-acetyltransferase
MSTLIRSYENRDIHEVREIFFESSSRREFSNSDEKEAFFYKYLGFYLERFSDFAWVAEREILMGYVVGASATDLNALGIIQPHLQLFEDHFVTYPAHLHINCHHSSRGLGIGGQLIHRFEDELKSRQIPGYHIVTGAQSRNKSFYERLGLKEISMENFQGHDMVLMGKKFET